AQALQAAGVGFSHLPIARHGISDTVSRHAPCQTTGTCKYCPFGARYAATNFLNDMLDWEEIPNFHVRTDVVVEEILVDSKKRATGVRVLDRPPGAREVITAKTIVVAAGTIESAKLLQRSTSSFWAQGIGNDRDLVGRNFITHPYFIFTGAIPKNPDRLQTE